MINFNLNGDKKIISFQFNYKEIHIGTENTNVVSMSKYQPTAGNIGFIFENIRNGAPLTDSEKHILTHAISEFKIKDYKCLCPLHILCLQSNNHVINPFLSMFIQAVLNHFNRIDVVNISECFTKKADGNSATKKIPTDNLDDDYIFKPGLINTNRIENLLIVDDVLDKGVTLNQILLNLSIGRFIDNDTKITVFTLYNKIQVAK